MFTLSSKPKARGVTSATSLLKTTLLFIIAAAAAFVVHPNNFVVLAVQDVNIESESSSSSTTTTTPPPPPVAVVLPEDCTELLVAEERTNFTATLIVTVTSDVLCATPEELDVLAQSLALAYNQLNVFNSDLCDPNSRFIFEVDILTDVGILTVNNNDNNDRRDRRDRLLSVGDEQRYDDDELWYPQTKQNLRGGGGQRQIQDTIDTTDTTVPTTAAPAAAAAANNNSTTDSAATTEVLTTIVEGQNGERFQVQTEETYVDLLFEISGTCNGCTNDIGLLELADDVSDRRRHQRRRRNLQEEEDDDTSAALLSSVPLVVAADGLVGGYGGVVVPSDVTTCECDENAEERPPTTFELLELFTEIVDGLLFVTAVENIVEVGVSQCSAGDDSELLETVETISINVEEVFGADADVTIDQIEEAFVCTYNWLATRGLCNPSFTSVSSATYIDGVIDQGDSTFTFEVNSTCTDCSAIFTPDIEEDEEAIEFGTVNLLQQRFVNEFNSRFDAGGTCFCPLEGPPRAPTLQEFEGAFGVCLFEPLPLPPIELCEVIQLFETQMSRDDGATGESFAIGEATNDTSSQVETDQTTEESTTAPTEEETSEPTESVTLAPTEDPTPAPTESTSAPTVSSTPEPTTDQPTNEPTGGPTATPTSEPTTDNPTIEPDFDDLSFEFLFASITEAPTPDSVDDSKSFTDTPAPGTNEPTSSPTFVPTSVPTHSPTSAPTTPEPTFLPSVSSTPPPTQSPTTTPFVTPGPTQLPSFPPTSSPTTAAPTPAPNTAAPTDVPTEAPVATLEPTTDVPTPAPNTAAPTDFPTEAPVATLEPTTVEPSPAPTTAEPTFSPSFPLPFLGPKGLFSCSDDPNVSTNECGFVIELECSDLPSIEIPTFLCSGDPYGWGLISYRCTWDGFECLCD